MQEIKEETKMKIIDFTWPAGFYSDGINAGLRQVKNDLGWLYSKVPAQAAGVYTTNQFQAAPTKLTKQTINAKHVLQAIVMNSANANSCTGAQGEADALAMQQLAATKLELKPALVGVASTGLIGKTLPMKLIKAGIKQLQLTKTTAVTNAILTTDKQPKTCSVQCKIAGKLVTISGFAKGSGMIHPKMATMLGFVTTDAAISGTQLQELLSQQVDATFNQITVDGDTSTNDMVVALANGLAGNQALVPNSPDYSKFKANFSYVLGELAKKIAADGEGASKLVEVNVHGAADKADGQKVAKAIVGSNLVKAAIFGEDPNWGRIMGAIGQTDAKLDISNVAIQMNGQALVKGSIAVDFDPTAMKLALAKPKIIIEVDLHNGVASGQAWGCDLTYNYVKINASYHN
ncbi:N-acetylglutamate synthase [Loigolactobacillus backii]|uniref:bifunctional glutamate N-acetyltransferase/amino-acid acetyltransferase ArgJ n=1 Tax=Loigolactobacillus backii TaxID=375175 RepID=UPI0007F15DE5|nr:bifunctional glutamate N-acetyltransferase/amino-acid acetyltransferase ArgJ [Loigolactobacillus backii]ANK60287.1 N-acetylglutamate synthase [Loigolactobacillus backii]ANK65169.1 N-acetylglutamate synthase [Loigolactobacillus backii]ANK67727.1 N-acetylglutamate synthase [Loigolactobacillus backii]OLF70206.1 N-acetylglutamate synthase [Loigolactobacillus backii]PIO87047.1 bifunctional ornithine acetyltransferase/N-acetylglutamate synthase [Loigolactobacillus backii]